MWYKSITMVIPISLTLSSLLLPTAEAQEYPELTSRQYCGSCVRPGEESQSYEIVTKTSVQKVENGWRYILTITNISQTNLRFLLTIRNGADIYYVGRAFNDKNRQPGDSEGNGALLVSVPKRKTVTLSMFDTFSPIEATAFALVIDEKDKGFAELELSLYMPQWPYLINKLMQ